PKTVGFWINVFPYLTDDEGYNSFQRHFRITLSTFRQIAIVLWRFANGVGIWVLEQTLGVSQGLVIHFTDRFLEALLDLEQERIKWPQGVQLTTVIQEFEHGITGLEHNLPNVIGAMDGSHIPIHPPINNSSRFVNRKNFHSINLLRVVDSRGRFTYIYAGEAGSVHDARVFYRSSLYYEISHNQEQWVPGGSYIIGDPAYLLKTYLMKPFPDHDSLTIHERQFNKKPSSMKMCIERAFGYLKGRWRILLSKIYCTDLERIV
ncbi:19026_t:CDS:2, partial [Cetraspora pellucida]